MNEVRERVEEVVRLVTAIWGREFYWVDCVEREDAISEGVVSVLERAEKFDPEKGSFSNFVCMSARHGMLRFVKGEVLEKKMGCSLEGLEDVLEGVGHDFYDIGKENVEAIMELSEGLDERKRYILREMSKGKSQVEIAKELGCSRQYVSFTFKKFKEECNREFIYENGVVSRRDEMTR